MAIVEIKIPSPGESITEVEIGNWLKTDGDHVDLDETLCEIETDKATLPLIAEVAGSLKILLQTGETAQVGEVACSINTEASSAATSSAIRAEEPLETPSILIPTGHPSPAAQKMMAENQLSSSQIPGSGRDGRITKQDVQQQLKAGKAPSTAPEKNVAPASKTESKINVPLVKASGSRAVTREKMSRLRLKLSERLVSVKNETAMLTTFNEVDMSEIFQLRKEMKEKFEKKYGIRLGFMGFFTRAVCEAIKDFPEINAIIDGTEVIHHDYVDVGIAVSSPKGLVVPVIRNAESMNIPQIEAELLRLAKRARENRISIDEMTGGTFSITNGGVFGSMLSTPILNPPQSAILGMHNVVERPIAVQGQVVIRPVMYLALSYDHRVIDGRESVSFLYKVKEYLETPGRILLGV